MSFELNWNLIAGLMLLVSGATMLGGSFVLKLARQAAGWFRPDNRHERDVEFGSDTPAPQRVNAYLKMISDTVVANCSPQIRWTYAAHQLTRAEVMEAELDRLEEDAE